MNLNERENYRQDDAYFQDDKTKYDETGAPSVDHSISDNAEPDYANDFAEDEINNQKLEDEIPNSDEFDNEFEDDQFEYEEDEESGKEDFGDDEEGTNPNRNL